MKILYFLMFYPTAHRHVAHDEMVELSRRGHHLKVVSVWGGEKDLYHDLPFEIIYIEHRIIWRYLFVLLRRYKIKILFHFRTLVRYLGIIDSLRFISNYPRINVGGYDIVHAHFASNNALKAYLISQFYKIPFSCTSHHSEILFYPLENLRELILNSTLFITISMYNKKYLINKYNIPDNKVIVNYCGVYLDVFSKQSKKITDIFTIISVAALKPIKGLNYLVEACKIISNRKVKYFLKIAGDGVEFDNLKNQIESEGLREHVKLLGLLDTKDLKSELEKSTLFVLPSLSEGIPVAIMEAMAMELPVIATNITGIPEIIDDGINGFLVEPKDSKALANKIIFLHDNPDIAVKMGREGRKAVEEKFNLKKNVARFEKLLKQINPD